MGSICTQAHRIIIIVFIITCPNTALDVWVYGFCHSNFQQSEIVFLDSWQTKTPEVLGCDSNFYYENGCNTSRISGSFLYQTPFDQEEYLCVSLAVSVFIWLCCWFIWEYYSHPRLVWLRFQKLFHRPPVVRFFLLVFSLHIPFLSSLFLLLLFPIKNSQTNKSMSRQIIKTRNIWMNVGWVDGYKWDEWMNE